VVGALFVLFLTGCIVALRRRQAACPGLERWTAAMVLYVLALLGITLMPAKIVWIVLIASALVAALVLALEGCRESCGLRPDLWTVYFVGVITIVGAGYFEYFNNLNARILVMSAFFVTIGILSAVTLLKNAPDGQELGARLTASSFVIFAVVATARGIYYQLAPPYRNFYMSSWAGGASYGAETLALMCCMVGWLVMMEEWLIANLEQERIRASSAAQRAAASNAAKNELMAMIGHELRNPLAGIVATMDVMLGMGMTAEQREYALAVSTSIEGMVKVTDDLLDLSNMESGTLAIEPSTFELRNQINAIAKVTEPLATGKGIGLAIGFSGGIPDRVIGDPGRIRQVIMNLVGNALKFTSHGQIRVDVEYHAQDETQGELRVAVTDTGIGIAPENIGTLFERDASAHASTVATYGGRGIGLAISQRLTELMGGRLDVESQVGRGSTFRVSLPLRVPGQASSAGHS
jgi:signal transduction histidine kinase